MSNINKNRETLKKHIEFIIMTLKTELIPESKNSLGQLKVLTIGSEIKLIVEEYLNRILYLLETDKESDINLKDFFFKMMKKYKQKIETNNKNILILQKISELNLIHDFYQIIENLKEFDLIDIDIDVDFILSYLAMFNIKKRIERYYIFFCPFSRKCVLPKKESICNFPNNKLCPEYQLKEKNLKLKFRNL